MAGEERAPPFGRFHPLGDSVVQVLVDIRCGDWVNWGSTHFSLCVREGFVEDDIDVIKPCELGNVLEAQRRIDIDDREHQQQNEYVFPNNTHAAALRAAQLIKRLPCGRPLVNSRLAQMVPGLRTVTLPAARLHRTPASTRQMMTLDASASRL
jgi:hypothetical protein